MIFFSPLFKVEELNLTKKKPLGDLKYFQYSCFSNLFFESAFTFVNRLFYFLVCNYRTMNDLNTYMTKFVDVIIRSKITSKVSVKNIYKGMFVTAIPFESALLPLRIKLIEAFSGTFTDLTHNPLTGSLFSGFTTGFALNAALTPLSKIVINVSIVQDFPKSKMEILVNESQNKSLQKFKLSRNNINILKIIYKNYMFFGLRGAVESLMLSLTFGLGSLFFQKNKLKEKTNQNLAKFEIHSDQELLTRLIENGYIQKNKKCFNEKGSTFERKVGFFTSIIAGVVLGLTLGITDTILLSYKKIHDIKSNEHLNRKLLKEMLLPSNFRILKYVCGIYWIKWEFRFLAYAWIDAQIRKYKINI